jgi:hypothetical protein
MMYVSRPTAISPARQEKIEPSPIRSSFSSKLFCALAKIDA